MKERIQKLVDKLSDLKIDAILVGSSANRRYLSGFSGSSALLYISKAKKLLITDFRYLQQAALEATEFEIVDQAQEGGLIETALAYGKAEQVQYIGFESEHTTYSRFLKLEAIDEFKFVPTEGVVEALRRIKSKEEIEYLRKAEAIGDQAFTKVLEWIQTVYKKQPITENEIALALEQEMRKLGATGTSFSSIVATGLKSALPHATPGQDVLKSGDFVVMDFGCVYKGYCSDMTRTIAVGEITKEQEKIYQTVLEAQEAALKAIKPGMKGSEVDDVARQIIKDAGYGEYFGHGLGHSVGIEIHENPRFSPLEESIIEPGMVITVEPGIYIPDIGGVRIEDLVLVTKDGIENFTHSTKKLIFVR